MASGFAAAFDENSRAVNPAGLERARRFTWEACADAAVAAMQTTERPKR